MRSGKMRLLWLGMTVLGLLYGSATAGNACTNENGEPLYDRLLYNDELTVALPKDWRVVESEAPGIMKYDDIIYYVQLGSRRLFAIDLTNSYNFSFASNTNSTNVKNNEIWATEYRRDGVLTNVVVKPPCGGFRYVMMWPITKDPGERRQVEASMKSINCVASPRPRL
jgi:hypothetical protein